MSLFQKLKQFRTNHKLVSALAEGSAAFAAGNSAAAVLDAFAGTQIIKEAKADFYDGFRGPNLLQLDQRLFFGKDGVNYTLLPKAFIDIDANGGIFAVAPFNYSPEQLPATGAGIGGYFSTEHFGLLGIVPVVYSAEGKTTAINPTMFTTILLQHFQLNPRVSYLLATDAKNDLNHSMDLGCTIGYQMDNITFGFDIGTGFDLADPEVKQMAEKLSYQGIIRIDFPPLSIRSSVRSNLPVELLVLS